MKSIKYIILVSGFLSCAELQNFSVLVNNLKVKDVKPDYKNPIKTSFIFGYDIVANSPYLPDMNLPVNNLGLGVFVEDVKALDSKLPPGVNSLNIGKPVTLESKVVIDEVKELASKIPSLVLKDQWQYAVKGEMNVKGRNFPINTKQTLDSPLSSGFNNIDKLKGLF